MKNKILDSIKGTTGVIIIILMFEALFRTAETTIFFGIDFNLVNWLLILLVVVIWLSELKDVEWINRMIKKIFR
jgi:hypothetical protein